MKRERAPSGDKHKKGAVSEHGHGDRHMISIPKLETIVEDIPRHKWAKEYYERDLKPHIKLVDVEGVLRAIRDGAVIEKLYPGKMNNEDNSAYDSLVSEVIFWYFSIHNNISIKEQMVFMRKQRKLFLQYDFASTVCSTLLPVCKSFFQEFLETDFAPENVANAFVNTPDYWGDPATCIDPSNIKNWSANARHAMVTIVLRSKSAEFKRKVVEALYNDPYALTRRAIRAEVKNGKLPKPRRE